MLCGEGCLLPLPANKGGQQAMKSKIWLLLLASLAILVLPLPAPALAMALGVSPGKMEFSVRPGGIQMQTLQVVNQAGVSSQFQVYVEGEHKEWFKIAPSEFFLDAQGTGDVEITLAPPLTAKPQYYEFAVCVISLPPGSGLRLGAGVKVPTHVELTELPLMAIQWWIVSCTAVLVIMITGLIILWRWKKRYV
jgi:hypothetical protein